MVVKTSVNVVKTSVGVRETSVSVGKACQGRKNLPGYVKCKETRGGNSTKLTV
jgi:hypothetical protein